MAKIEGQKRLMDCYTSDQALAEQGFTRGRTWSQGLLSRHTELSRKLVHAEARIARARNAKVVSKPRTIDLASLAPDVVAYSSFLSTPSPHRTLAWSMAITDAAVREVTKNTIHSPLHLGGLIGALVERELWELPIHDSTMSTNVALSRVAGAYFTPPNVAWYITVRTIGPVLDAALRENSLVALRRAANIRVLDPACGAGIFLFAALELLMNFYHKALHLQPNIKKTFGTPSAYKSRLVTKQLFGADTSNRFVRLARQLLARIANISECAVTGIRVGDALVDTCDPSFDPNVCSKPVDWPSELVSRGANIVLLNPPFGRLRVQISDFQEKSRAFQLTPDDFARIYNARKEALARLITYFRKSAVYRPAIGGVLDWQRLFVAKSIAMLKVGGRLGAIVPVSFLSDKTACRLRRHVIENTCVDRIDRFHETAKFFPGVNQPTAILVTTKGKISRSFRISVPLKEIPATTDKSFVVRAVSIKRFSPHTWSIPGTDRRGWRVLEHLHSHPRISQLKHVLNYRGEFDLTINKEHIGRGRTRLIRGDHIERFQLRNVGESQREGLVGRTSFLASIGTSKKVAHVCRPRLVGRQCAFLEKPRRLSFALIPANSIVANSCNYLLWNEYPQEDGLLFLCGILNSLVAEWRIRQTSSNNHINNYELDDFPLPACDPSIVVRETKKVLAHYSVSNFGASALGSDELEDALDTAVFAAYGLEEEHIETIVSSAAPARAERLLAKRSL